MDAAKKRDQNDRATRPAYYCHCCDMRKKSIAVFPPPLPIFTQRTRGGPVGP